MPNAGSGARLQRFFSRLGLRESDRLTKLRNQVPLLLLIYVSNRLQKQAPTTLIRIVFHDGKQVLPHPLFGIRRQAEIRSVYECNPSVCSNEYILSPAVHRKGVPQEDLAKPSCAKNAS